MGSSVLGGIAAHIPQGALSLKRPPAQFPNPWGEKRLNTAPAGGTAAGQVAITNFSGSETARIHKLHKAASEFEGLLLSNWWRTMKESGWADDDGDGDPAKDTFDQLGIQAVSQAVAKGGGFGIAKLLVQGLLKRLQAQEQREAEKSSQKVTG
ncbi:MAG TPA: hypothetical protein VMU61_09600 [Candidatus Aquilonibacter sp.]|nr:hypothetical protein [Candidatus Aquilonibacter sp.]